MAKLDWSKAGHQMLDPARVRSVEDFSVPDPVVKTRKRASSPSVWGDAMKSLRRVESQRAQANELPIDQKALLAALGLSRGAMKRLGRGTILRRLVREGVLLPTGSPNPNNPKVLAVLARLAANAGE